MTASDSCRLFGGGGSSYEAAACEMIERTGSESSPWMLVEGNNKEWARVKVLKEVVRRVRSALK